MYRISYIFGAVALYTLISGCSAAGENIAIIEFNATLPVYQFLLPGAGFYKHILSWNDKQIADLKSEALNFFGVRFGIKEVDKHPDFNLMFIETNPKVDLRCVMLSGDDVPKYGFRVFEGGYIALVKNPNGVQLGGEFRGKKAVFGQTFSLGHMYIERLDKNGKPLKPYIFKQKHLSPGAVAKISKEQTTTSELEVETVSGAPWSSGSSLSVAKYSVDAKGMAHAKLRNFYEF